MSVFYQDPSDIRITLNGFPLYGVDENGGEWHTSLNGVNGLFDGVGSTLQTSEKAWSDGWYGNIPTAQGRSITIEGHIYAPCAENLITSWDLFKRSFSIDEQTMIVQVGSLSRRLTVMQSSSAPLIEAAGRNMLKFSIGLTALSPYLFGTQLMQGTTGLPQTEGGMTFPYHFADTDGENSTWRFNEDVTSGAINLTNPGTAPAPVTVRIDGPVVNPRYEHTPSGRVMAFDYTLGAGHYIQINGQTHEILIDGTDPARGAVTRREWAYAEPGQNIWRFSADEQSDSALLTVQFYPAYI